VVDFQDIQINLPDDAISEESSSYSLKQLLQRLLAVETLDVNNSWNCTQCSQKVQALKSIQYETLPNTLFLHIKRLGFDQVIY
jgi:ubiquitin C-terminal hydrolase